MAITHDDLVESARRWLCKTHCIVITEMSDGVSEKPDAIGWRAGNETTLIECKVSHQDFISDKKKLSRRSLGMGDFRYYLAPKGLIRPDELPEGWGLLEPYGNGLTAVVTYVGKVRNKDCQMETNLLVTALRRIKGMMPRGTSVKSYYYETGNTATLGIKRVG